MLKLPHVSSGTGIAATCESGHTNSQLPAVLVDLRDAIILKPEEPEHPVHGPYPNLATETPGCQKRPEHQDLPVARFFDIR